MLFIFDFNQSKNNSIYSYGIINIIWYKSSSVKFHNMVNEISRNWILNTGMRVIVTWLLKVSHLVKQFNICKLNRKSKCPSTSGFLNRVELTINFTRVVYLDLVSNWTVNILLLFQSISKMWYDLFTLCFSAGNWNTQISLSCFTYRSKSLESNTFLSAHWHCC
jgi:hypothetical protein